MKNDSPNNVPESTIHVLCRKGRRLLEVDPGAPSASAPLPDRQGALLLCWPVK